MAIDLDSIHLWCTFLGVTQEESLFHEYERLFGADANHRGSRSVFALPRHRYLVTRAVVRTVLSRYADLSPAEWVFASNAYGRPEIANDHGPARDISFNVSHTSGLIVLGVAHRRALGVDTENARTR